MRRLTGLAATATVLMAVAGCAHGQAATAGATRRASAVVPSPSPSKSAPSASKSAPAAAKAAAGFRSPRTYTAVALPVRLRIPAIGVDAPLEHLGLDADGTIAAPGEWQDAGWYEDGPRPGEPGPAIMLGHVDSTSGPAVFYRLAKLPPGTQVLVDRADGTTVRFRTQGRMQVAKSQFPADLVYAPTLAPSLRLVTCGGKFNEGTRHYRDNIIVTALPERSRG